MSLSDPDVVRREYETEAGLDARASVYAHGEFGERDARRSALDAVAEVAPGRVLEVGCGRGEFAERTAGVVQVRKPVYGTSVDRWRRYEQHLGPLVEALGDGAAWR